MIAGKKNEDAAGEAVELRRKLDAETATRIDREKRVAELEDENHRLKTPPPPPPVKQKKSWLDGATFFD